MLRRIPRLLRISILVAVLLAVSASVYQTWTTGNAGILTTQTGFGPLSYTDRDLLVKVRLAGLWEGPTSEQATQMASSAEVREIGRKLAAEHTELDVEVRRVASQLGVPLPSSPTPAQVNSINQISAQTGSDYDRTYVQIIRQAHGQVLPVINDVRVSTRNDLIRQFAETADAFVMRHCQYLESTGLVDYSALPATQVSLTNMLTNGTSPQALVTPILAFVAVMLGVIALLSVLRKKKEQQNRSERVTVTRSRPQAKAEPIPALAVAALPAGGGSSSADSVSRVEGSVPAAAYPMKAPVPVGAMPAAGSPMGGATSEPSVQWALGGPGFRDTGPHPTIDAPGPYAPVSDSGAYRIANPETTGPIGPPIRDGYPIHGDQPGGHRPGYEGGYPGAPSGPDADGHHNGHDAGQYPPAASGQYRTVSETGSRRIGDSGRYRVSDSGSYRRNGTGPRHSVRR